MVILLTVAGALADCPDDARSLAMQSAAELERAFANLDDAAFDAAHLRLKEAIPCVREELAISDAVVLHRARAIGAFVDGDEPASARSWAAVRSLQPDWQPSGALMPAGHPLRALWEGARSDTAPPMVPLQEAPRGGWSVDGVRTNGVPASRAFVLQGLDGSGAIVHTGYHHAVADIPALNVEMIPTERVRVDSGANRRSSIRRWGTVGAGALALGAGASFVVSTGAQRELNSPEVQVSDVDDLKSRANTFAGVGAGLGVGALGTLAFTWAVPW